MTRVLRYLWIVGGAVMSILLFLLAFASENSEFFDKNYSWLVSVNILVAFLLLILLIWMLFYLVKRYRRGKFGSKLTARLVILFALMGILPGTIIYIVSIQFVSRSIESWFDVHVESALDSGVKLAQSILETSKKDLTIQARHLANDLAELPLSEQTLLLTRFRNNKDDIEAIVINNTGRLIATSGIVDISSWDPYLPSASMLNQVRTTSHYSAIESEITDPAVTNPEETDLVIRVIVSIPVHSLSVSRQNTPCYLQLLQKIPANVASNAEALRATYSEYQIRSLSRSGLRKIYIVTLSLTLLLVIFSAIVCAFQIASTLAKPLLLLAQGTKAVSEGNLSPRPIVSSNDELGILTQSFNTMTHQLAEARAQAEKSRADLEAAKIYLESVLANMSSGVIVLDHQFKLVGCNDSVTRILRQDLSTLIGEALPNIDKLTVFSAAITKAFAELSAQTAANGGTDRLHWQQQIEIPHNSDNPNEMDITLLARGSYLISNETRYIVVFDDITEIISAQRSITWGEVARRLAHEIKNPLTPIQLSAERLQMKLHDKLSEQDAAILKRSTDTIVNQVTSMKQMVNDFRNFAKKPPVILKPLDLNALVEEIVHLYTGHDSYATIHTHFSTDLPRIMGDETQLRQVIHNLLQNAQDAVSEVQKREHYTPNIELMTEKIHYQVASGKIHIAVRLSVMDNGPGFAKKILARIFEPYITTKERGTGLGMAIVKKIVDEHGGRIDVQNRTDTNGAKVSILFLQLALPENQETQRQVGNENT